MVLLSGGLDSATVLAVARDRGYACHAISYDYGQRHGAELAAAQHVAAALGAVEHKVVSLDLGSIGGSALTDDAIDVPETPSEGIPVTYVPARNTVFLAIALGWAEVLGARDLFIGVNAVDYSGYPDCRPEYIAAFESLANLATKAGVEGERFRVHAPLVDLSKADVVTLYLLPSLNVKLIPQLEKLKPGSRIVSHSFDMEGVIPDKKVEVESPDGKSSRTVYLWTVPLKRERE